MRLLATALLAACTIASAQHADYRDLKTREIKALSAQQMDDLQAGRGMGLSLPAELNGVPGPLHVLELREQLKLSDTQAAATAQVRDEMRAAAQPLGVAIIAAERELERGFQDGTATEQTVAHLTRRLGELNAQLRAAHLNAHLQTGKLLTQEQRLAYNQARGYTPAAHQHAHH
jgi:hypothetical protein